MKLPSNVVAFAAGNETPYLMFRDYWNHYRSINGNDESKKFDFITVKKDGTPISFAEKEAEMNATLKREIARVANISLDGYPLEAWVTNPMISWATFAVVGAMIDTVLPESLVDSIGLYTEIKTGGIGDSFSFTVKPRDLFVVSKSSRARRTTEVHKQFNGMVTVLPQPREITVEVSLYRVLAGLESLADFTAKILMSMENQVAVDAFTAFNSAMAALPTSPANLALRVAGYTQAGLVNLAQTVTAWNGGSKALVVGTQLALASILPDNTNFRYMVDSDYVKIGYLRTISGYDIMALPQVADWKNPFGLVLDDKKIYVVSPATNKPIKLCLEGATTSNVTAPYANANLTQTATIQKSWGVAVATNVIAGVITLP